MLDSIQITEMFLQSKRDDIERVVQRQKLLAEIDQAKRGVRARQAVACALMRIARVIDESADGRIAAPAAQ
jgi:hypothetical protein